MRDWYVCQECGIQFQRQRGRGPLPRYCSEACRRQPYERKKKELRQEARHRRIEETGHPNKYKSSRQREERRCPVCGATFMTGPNHWDQMHCSIACANVTKNKARAKVQPCTCQECEKTFVPKATNRTSYCSRECYFAHIKAKPKESPLLICKECGKPFYATRTNVRYCSDECRKQWANRNAYQGRETKSCSVCGNAFLPDNFGRPKQYCSLACANHSEAIKRGKRIAKAKRRARQRTLSHESVDPIAVFERDGWRCYLCGCRTPKRLRGTFDSRAPELDHVIPLSKDGPHTYANTACTCRACNQAKSDRLVEHQMRMMEAKAVYTPRGYARSNVASH